MLIQDEKGNDILVDGGPDDTVLEKLGRYLPPWDRTIEMVILTHPHADHVNGLVSVLSQYHVLKIVRTDVPYASPGFRTFESLSFTQHIPETIVTSSVRLIIGDMNIDTLWPNGSFASTTFARDVVSQSGGVNDTSIVFRLTYQNHVYLFMGDASSLVEKNLIALGLDLHSLILKVGHHGSKYASSADFLRAVQPVFSMIEVGVGNKYGHPTTQTLLRLQQASSTVFRTDLDGDIRVLDNGKDVRVEKESEIGGILHFLFPFIILPTT